MAPRDMNSNRGVSAKEYSVCIIQCVIQYCSVVFSIIKYCEFSDIKELVDQVLSDRQLAHRIAVGTTSTLPPPPGWCTAFALACMLYLRKREP